MSKEAWEAMFEVIPQQLSKEERTKWISSLNNVAVSSDAFFPFSDNVLRAKLVITIDLRI